MEPACERPINQLAWISPYIRDSTASRSQHVFGEYIIICLTSSTAAGVKEEFI